MSTNDFTTEALYYEQQARPLECDGDRPMTNKTIKKSRLDYLREYRIGITFLSSGCIVEIGCKNIAFSTIKDAMDAVSAYVANPEEEVTKWMYKFNNEE